MANQYSGQATAAQINASGRLEPDYIRQLVRNFAPEEYIISSILGATGNNHAATRFQYIQPEEVPIERVVFATAPISAAATTLYVDRTGMFGTPSTTARVVCFNARTLEQFDVTAIVTADISLTIARATGVTAAAAMLADDPIVIISMPVIDGAAFHSILVRHTDQFTQNITKLERRTGITWQAENEKSYTGPEAQRLDRQNIDAYKMDQEVVLGFMEPAVSAQATPYAATTGDLSYAAGLRYWARRYGRMKCRTGICSLDLISSMVRHLRARTGHTEIKAIIPWQLFDQLGKLGLTAGVVRTPIEIEAIKARIKSFSINSGSVEFMGCSTMDRLYANREIWFYDPQAIGMATFGPADQVIKRGHEINGAWYRDWNISTQLALHIVNRFGVGIIEGIDTLTL